MDNTEEENSIEVEGVCRETTIMVIHRNMYFERYVSFRSIRVTEQDGGGILVKIFGINEPRASRDVTKSLADPTNTVSTSNTIISPFLLPFQHSTFIAARFTISTNCRFITVKPIIFILFFFSPTNR